MVAHAAFAAFKRNEAVISASAKITSEQCTRTLGDRLEIGGLRTVLTNIRDRLAQRLDRVPRVVAARCPHQFRLENRDESGHDSVDSVLVGEVDQARFVDPYLVHHRGSTSTCSMERIGACSRLLCQVDTGTDSVLLRSVKFGDP